MYISRYSFVSEIYKFELPNLLFLIGFHSTSLLMKILFLLKKCIVKLVKYKTSNNKLMKHLDYKSF